MRFFLFIFYSKQFALQKHLPKTFLFFYTNYRFHLTIAALIIVCFFLQPGEISTFIHQKHTDKLSIAEDICLKLFFPNTIINILGCKNICLSTFWNIVTFFSKSFHFHPILLIIPLPSFFNQPTASL